MARHLIQPRFKNAEYERAIHVATLESGVTWEDAQAPEFWAHVAAKVRRYDHIEVRTDDSSFWGELLVMDSGKGYVKTSVLRFVELASAPVKSDGAAGYKIMWKGPHHKFTVIRESDSLPIHSGEPEKSGAEKWLEAHLKAMA